MKRVSKVLLPILLLSLVISCKTDPFIFRIDDTLEYGGGQTAKVIILSGQSNASGASLLEYLQKEDGYGRLCVGFDNVFTSHYELANGRTTNGFVPTRPGLGYAETMFGPELGLADVLSSSFADETVFIVKITYAGASLCSDFNPDRRKAYSKIVKFISRSLSYLESKGYRPEIVGLCWMQGETDATDIRAANDYHGFMEDFVSSLRRDVCKDLRIYDAAISNNDLWVNSEVVNDAKRALSEELEGYEFIDTNAAGLTTANEPYGNPDLAHYDAGSEVLLGRLFANKIIENL